MAPKVTSSSNRSGRKPAKPRPITTSKGRGNRANVSSARVTNDTTRPPNGSGGARVTNANNRGVDASTARVTGGTPASPPLTRRSRVNGRVVAGTDTRGNRPAPAKPAAQPANPVKSPGIPAGRPANYNMLTNPTQNRGAGQRPTGGQAGGRAGLPSGRIAGQSSSAPTTKPPAKPSLRGALRGAVGRGNALILALSAANAVQDSLMTPEQRKRKAEAEIRPLTMADMPGQGGGSGRGGTTADVRAAAPAKPRVSNIPPAEGTGRGGPSDIKRTQPKPPTRPSGDNPPAPGSIRRQPGSGGGSSAPSRPSRPQTSSGTAGKGQQWSDFNPNRGTSQTNNPLIKKDDWMMSRMKDREAGQQANDSMKVGNKFDTKSDVYTPNTKVDGSGLDTKKIDQKKVDEYKRRKNRYYD